MASMLGFEPGPHWWEVSSLTTAASLCSAISLLVFNIVIKANKVENNGVVVYVESSLTVHTPLFFVHKL